MGFAAPVTAALIGAGGSIGGSLINRMGRGSTPQQSSLINEQLATARQLRSQGQTLFSMSSPLIQQATGYYSKLLGGDQQALREATTPERMSLEDTYRGAERGLASGPLRGGARDYAAAELARQKTGQLGGLIPAARRAAAEAGSNLGLGVVGAANGATGGASSAFATLAGQGEASRQFNAGENRLFGSDLGETIAGGLQSKAGGKSKTPASTSAPLVSSRTYAPPRLSGSGLVEMPS